MSHLAACGRSGSEIDKLDHQPGAKPSAAVRRLRSIQLLDLSGIVGFAELTDSNSVHASVILFLLDICGVWRCWFGAFSALRSALHVTYWERACYENRS